MATLEQMEDEMEELMKAMDDEYEKNKESPLYLELYTKFCELEPKYNAAKKESDDYYDAFNNRPKRCIHCGAHKGETTKCPGEQK
jgi:hypothetical protein